MVLSTFKSRIHDGVEMVSSPPFSFVFAPPSPRGREWRFGEVSNVVDCLISHLMILIASFLSKLLDGNQGMFEVQTPFFGLALEAWPAMRSAPGASRSVDVHPHPTYALPTKPVHAYLAINTC